MISGLQKVQPVQFKAQSSKESKRKRAAERQTDKKAGGRNDERKERL